MIKGSTIFQLNRKHKELTICKAPGNDFFPPNVYIYVQLKPFGFFKRLAVGLKYILGITGIKGHWEMMRLEPSDVPALQDLINHLDEKVLPPTDSKGV
jgi:hypothetical protein